MTSSQLEYRIADIRAVSIRAKIFDLSDYELIELAIKWQTHEENETAFKRAFGVDDFPKVFLEGIAMAIKGNL